MASLRSSRALLVSSVLAAWLVGAGSALVGSCGPFTDVAADAFCPFVLEVFYVGITTGTTATTYDPTGNVSRLQMAAFLSRTVDGTLKRASRRAALRQTWTPQGESNLGVTTIGTGVYTVECDGLDLWLPANSGNVYRVRTSDGRLLETWTGATSAFSGVLCAMGKVFTAGQASPSKLYRIDPAQPAGSVTTVASNLAAGADGIGFDGGRIWVAGFLGSVSIVTPGPGIPWTTTTVAAGFTNPGPVVYDGANIWITDSGKLLKVDSLGAILQTVTIGGGLGSPVFDGTNLWIPNSTLNVLSVVRPSSGAILATLTGNGLNGPVTAAFDGQRILVTDGGTDSVSLWKAADFTTLGSYGVGPGTGASGACSDGVNFWIALYQAGKVVRF